MSKILSTRNLVPYFSEEGDINESLTIDDKNKQKQEDIPVVGEGKIRVFNEEGYWTEKKVTTKQSSPHSFSPDSKRRQISGSKIPDSNWDMPAELNLEKGRRKRDFPSSTAAKISLTPDLDNSSSSNNDPASPLKKLSSSSLSSSREGSAKTPSPPKSDFRSVYQPLKADSPPRSQTSSTNRDAPSSAQKKETIKSSGKMFSKNSVDYRTSSTSPKRTYTKYYQQTTTHEYHLPNNTKIGSFFHNNIMPTTERNLNDYAATISAVVSNSMGQELMFKSFDDFWGLTVQKSFKSNPKREYFEKSSKFQEILQEVNSFSPRTPTWWIPTPKDIEKLNKLFEEKLKAIYEKYKNESLEQAISHNTSFSSVSSSGAAETGTALIIKEENQNHSDPENGKRFSEEEILVESAIFKGLPLQVPGKVQKKFASALCPPSPSKIPTPQFILQ